MTDRRTALIIGSASGIGLATARRMAAQDHNLVMVDRSQEALDSVAQELRDAGATVLALSADALQAAEVERVTRFAMDEFGRIDAMACVVGGAGGINIQNIEEISQAQWEKVINININTTYLACHHVVPIMREQQYGRITCMSSTAAAGRFSPIGTTGTRLAYATAKMGLIGFTKQLAKDEGPNGITVNTVLPWLTFGGPGTPVQDLFYQQSQEYQDMTFSHQPQGRAMTADGVAAAFAFLMSEDAGFISGVALPVDGGFLN